VSVSELHNGLEMLLSLSKVKIDVATSYHNKAHGCIALLCLNYHLQYFVFCV